MVTVAMLDLMARRALPAKKRYAAHPFVVWLPRYSRN
jgi:hypothetical protein